MSNNLKDKQEQLAVKYHTSYYGVHVFYIRDMKEYLTMLPFTKIFPNTKLILARKLRDSLINKVIAKDNKRVYKRNWQREYRRRKDTYMC